MTCTEKPVNQYCVALEWMCRWSQELTREFQVRAGVSATGTHRCLQHLLQARTVVQGRPKGPESAVHPSVAFANLSALIGTCDLAIALNGVLLSRASNDSPIGKYTDGQLLFTS